MVMNAEVKNEGDSHESDREDRGSVINGEISDNGMSLEVDMVEDS